MKLDVPLSIPEGEDFPECESTEELNRWLWRHVQIPQLVYLITTVNPDGSSNCEVNNHGLPFGPVPTQMFGFVCWRDHHTARNILRDREFVVNVPSAGILEPALKTARSYGRGVDEIAESGLTPLPSRLVGPPRIEECPLHLECKLDWYNAIGSAGMIFLCGQIVAASGDREALTGGTGEKLAYARPVFIMPRGIDAQSMKMTGTGATVAEVGKIRPLC